MSNTDTIFALSSGRLPAGVAVVRVSGSKVRFVLETIFGSVPMPRAMSYGSFRGNGAALIDKGLVVFFEGPNSFTGEDSCEFHVHGGVAVVRSLNSVLSEFDGVRNAEPGEFTRRAFINGKLDLTQAEGLGDLINAETEAQRRLALVQSDGGLRTLYEGWRSRILLARSMVEAVIDFSEEEDVTDGVLGSLDQTLSDLMAEISTHTAGFRQSEIIREGYRVVILGAPNSGKSTLINALAGREVAIATEEPGTTRDLIDVRLDLAGNLVIVTDTAGIRKNPGRIEAIGIDKARSRAEAADLIVLVEDVSNPAQIDLGPSSCAVLRVGNKVDTFEGLASGYDLLISAKTGIGIDALLTVVATAAEKSVSASDLFAIHDRHVGLLSAVVGELGYARKYGFALDLVAEHLRLASDQIGRLTGRIGVEELLGAIFSKFCIGK